MNKNIYCYWLLLRKLNNDGNILIGIIDINAHNKYSL
jgi:hypothetical protein